MTVCGILFGIKKTVSISIIGSPDGPTSVFLAGTVGRNIAKELTVSGLIILIISTVLLVKMKKRK